MKTGIVKIRESARALFKGLRPKPKRYPYAEMESFQSLNKIDLWVKRVHIIFEKPEKVSLEIKRRDGETEVTFFDSPVQTVGVRVHAEMLSNLVRRRFLPDVAPETITWNILYRNWEKNYDHRMDVKFRFDNSCVPRDHRRNNLRYGETGHRFIEETPDQARKAVPTRLLHRQRTDYNGGSFGFPRVFIWKK